MTSQSKTTLKRDDKWLLSRMDLVWNKYFSDIPKSGQVFIKFGRFARFRLGSISLDKKTKASRITITSMFKDPKIPVDVIDYTIGHELVHYTHGFSSIHPRLHKYPHAGGVVGREMKTRGMENLSQSYKAWIKSYRQSLRRRYVW